MKNILILVLVALLMIACREPGQRIETSRYVIYIMDSCEYLKPHDAYGLVHKGNCKYCAERRKKELKDLVLELKGE